jgi:predicted amidohydrolase
MLGLTVCYDLRFPQLYRSLAQSGAEFLTIPSAFTVPTGKAHWHVLLRARAIENGCFVFAPAQGGEHAEGRRTYGHSLIVAPWGEILAEAVADEPGFVVADIDPAKVAEARRAVPSLRHDRAFASPTGRPAAAE